MKSLLTLKLSFLLLLFIITNSCKKGGKCEEALNVKQSEIVVLFKDAATGRYLYSEIYPLYNKDSLRIYDPLGNSLALLSLLRSAPDNVNEGVYFISFGNVYNDQTDKSSFNTELCKNFIIKYSHTETDTLTVCFKSKNTSCGSVFETLKVYENGKLLAQNTNNTFAEVTVIKK